MHLERKEVAQLLPSVDDEVLEKHLGVWGWACSGGRRAAARYSQKGTALELLAITPPMSLEKI